VSLTTLKNLDPKGRENLIDNKTPIALSCLDTLPVSTNQAVMEQKNVIFNELRGQALYDQGIVHALRKPAYNHPAWSIN